MDNPFNPENYDDRQEEYERVVKFMERVSKGITSKIPDNVEHYIEKPTVGELESAAMFLARNMVRLTSSSETPEHASIAHLTNSMAILIRSTIHDAVENKKRIITDEDFDMMCRKVAESTYKSNLLKAGLTDVLFSDDPEEYPDIVLNEKGLKEYPDLYLYESRRKSYLTDTLEKLVGGKDKSDQLLKTRADKLDGDPIYKMLNEFFKPRKESDSIDDMD